MFRLDQFMRVCDDDVTLPDGRKVTVRTLSELESNARYDYGVAEALRVSEALKTKESEMYQLKVLPLYDATLETVQSLLAQGRIAELVREAGDLYRMDFIPAPDDATLSEEVEAMKQQEQFEKGIYESRTKHIVDGVTAYKNKLAELPKETLMREIELRAQQIYSSAYAQDAEMYYTVWCCTEINEKKVWKNPEEVKNLPGKLISFLYDKYKKVDEVDPWEITKSVTTGKTGGMGQDSPDQPVATG
jgi:hypothetical protein